MLLLSFDFPLYARSTLEFLTDNLTLASECEVAKSLSIFDSISSSHEISNLDLQRSHCWWRGEEETALRSFYYEHIKSSCAISNNVRITFNRCDPDRLLTLNDQHGDESQHISLFSPIKATNQWKTAPKTTTTTKSTSKSAQHFFPSQYINIYIHWVLHSYNDIRSLFSTFFWSSSRL